MKPCRRCSLLDWRRAEAARGVKRRLLSPNVVFTTTALLVRKGYCLLLFFGKLEELISGVSSNWGLLESLSILGAIKSAGWENKFVLASLFANGDNGLKALSFSLIDITLSPFTTWLALYYFICSKKDQGKFEEAPYSRSGVLKFASLLCLLLSIILDDWNMGGTFLLKILSP